MSAPRRQRRKEARPAEIMAAAMKLFSERGFAATRLEDVAEAAGVSKATIYLYFDSKAELFKALVRDIAVARIGQIEAMVESSDAPSAKLLRNLIETIGDIAKVQHMRGLMKIIISEAGNFPEIISFYREEVAMRGLNNITRIVARGTARGEFRQCDPVSAAKEVIFPMIMSALTREIFGPLPQFDIQDFIPDHIEFVLHGLAANRETK